MKNKSRHLVLLGAGAVLDWGGPKTLCGNEEFSDSPKICCLTHFIRSIGFKTKNNETVTNFIWKLLISDLPRQEVNFETIISSIEELIIFFTRKPNSLLPSFMEHRESIEEIFCFTTEGNEEHGFELNIPNFPYSDRRAINKETPRQFFLQLLLVYILDALIEEISNYSYHTTSENEWVVANENSFKINNDFFRWINRIIQSNGIVRMYTLNYDRLFKVILEKKGINLFEGFEFSEIAPGDLLAPNLQKIYADVDSNVYYNLHGSAYWEVQHQNHRQLSDHQFFLTGIPSLPSNSLLLYSKEIERGKLFIPSNIVTGYQKAQRVSLPPFRQMQASFDRDCLVADRILIVGYSWSDEHINESIRSALRVNPNAEIVIIDPAYISHGYDLKLALNVFKSSTKNMTPKKDQSSANLYHYLENTIRVHTLTFKDYLAYSPQ